MEYFRVIETAMGQFAYQLAYFIPKLIVAYLIWLLGKYAINLAVGFISRIDLKQTKLDDQAIKFINAIVAPFGKVLLFFVVLDYLGIGRTVIGAILNALTMAIAISLGIAFGRALEGEARGVVERAKSHWHA